jgi:hypothetical protein
LCHSLEQVTSNMGAITSAVRKVPSETIKIAELDGTHITAFKRTAHDAINKAMPQFDGDGNIKEIAGSPQNPKEAFMAASEKLHTLVNGIGNSTVRKGDGFLHNYRWPSVLMINAYAFAVLTLFFITMGSYVWTRSALPSSDVAFLDPVSHPQRQDIWNVDHIFFMLNLFVYMVPVFVTFLAILNPLRNGMFVINFIVTLLMTAFNLAMLIWNCVKWGQCEKYTVCRNMDPLGDPSRPNYYWWFYFFGHIVISLLLVLMFIVYLFVRGKAVERFIPTSKKVR